MGWRALRGRVHPARLIVRLTGWTQDCLRLNLMLTARPFCRRGDDSCVRGYVKVKLDTDSLTPCSKAPYYRFDPSVQRQLLCACARHEQDRGTKRHALQLDEFSAAECRLHASCSWRPRFECATVSSPLEAAEVLPHRNCSGNPTLAAAGGTASSCAPCGWPRH
jgi:hypothetical protein